ncbi:hypothetical protein THRCLA_09486, partial [Thraustotheca clavata]
MGFKANILFAAAAVVAAADIDHWGVQDIWVHTSTWTAAHCQCFCEKLCSHPTEYLKKNLVSSTLVPRFKNGTIPACDTISPRFSPNAIRAVGQTNLVNYYPLAMSRDLEHMWDPNSAEPRYDVGSFGYPCGGLHETAYLKTIVQLAKFIKTPAIIPNNIGKNISTQSIRDAFKKDQKLDAVLVCSGGAFADVLTCWSKSVPYLYQTEQGDQEIAPMKPVACPPAIKAFDTCTGKLTHIYDFKPTIAPTAIPTSEVPTEAPTAAPTSTPSPSQDPDEVDAWVKNFTKD